MATFPVGTGGLPFTSFTITTYSPVPSPDTSYEPSAPGFTGGIIPQSPPHKDLTATTTFEGSTPLGHVTLPVIDPEYGARAS